MNPDPELFRKMVNRLFNHLAGQPMPQDEIIAQLVIIHNEAMLNAIGPLPDLSKYEEFITNPGIIDTDLKAHQANLIDTYARHSEHQHIKYRAGLITSVPNPVYYRRVG